MLPFAASLYGTLFSLRFIRIQCAIAFPLRYVFSVLLLLLLRHTADSMTRHVLFIS